MGLSYSLCGLWNSVIHAPQTEKQATMASFEQIATMFVQHYYNTFDTNRAALQPLYQDSSMLSWENERMQGVANIMKKLTSLNFQTVKHIPVTIDSQPSPGSGIVVFVCGHVVVDNNEAQPLKFAEVFTLMPTGQPNGLFVLNHIFRLNIG